MLRCADKSFYVGSTSYDDIEIRVAEHNDARYVGYTTSRQPVVLVWSKWFDDLRDAHATERRLKGWSRAKKIALIADDEAKLKKLAERRTSKPARQQEELTKRQLAALAHKIGARKGAILAQPRRSSSKARTGGSDIPAAKLVSSRHPEVRQRAKRGGAPKDD
jgi:putative endonuclease